MAKTSHKKLSPHAISIEQLHYLEAPIHEQYHSNFPKICILSQEWMNTKLLMTHSQMMWTCTSLRHDMRLIRLYCCRLLPIECNFHNCWISCFLLNCIPYPNQQMALSHNSLYRKCISSQFGATFVVHSTQLQTLIQTDQS